MVTDIRNCMHAAFVFLFRRTLDEKLCSPRSLCYFWNHPYFDYYHELFETVNYTYENCDHT